MKYVVLRDRGRWSPGAGVSGIRFQGPAAEISELPGVEVVDVTVKERQDLARDPDVKERLAPLMPTRLIEPRDSGAENEAGDSWGIAAVNADVSDFTGADIRVAVLDSGIDRTHPAFAGVSLVEEDFSGWGNGDKHGHGTHCAGTIFGRDVDGSRIGVARGVRRALIGKIIGDKGHGDSAAMHDGINWAVAQKAQVISMSVGLDYPGMVDRLLADGWPADIATSFALEAYRENLRLFDRLMDLIRARAAFGPGCVIVAAAGNESRRDENPEYEIATSLPAAAAGVLSAGALARSPAGYAIAPYSNAGPKLCAPGSGIKSAALGGGLCTMSGTSMACPHVAGVAALWWEAVRAMPVDASADTVKSEITAACRTDGLAPGMRPAMYGRGMITAPKRSR